MSILIEGINLPLPGECYCWRIYADGSVTIGDGEHEEQIGTARVLLPHGDLIDRDALLAQHIEAERGQYGGRLVVGDNRFLRRCMDAPVIVPGEDKDEHTD